MVNITAVVNINDRRIEESIKLKNEVNDILHDKTTDLKVEK